MDHEAVEPLAYRYKGAGGIDLRRQRSCTVLIPFSWAASKVYSPESA